MSETIASDIHGKLKTIFFDVLSTETVPVEQRTRLNCMHWDSLNHLKLIAAIEQEFQTTLSDEDVMDLNSFEMAVEIVKSKFS
jgi:acyl carrier protein